jgi:hypothetical protein
MRVAEIKIPFRLDKFIIEQYGAYNEYFKSVICYYNPWVSLLDLRAGTKLLVPSRDEIARLGRIRGKYDLVRK